MWGVAVAARARLEAMSPWRTDERMRCGGRLRATIARTYCRDLSIPAEASCCAASGLPARVRPRTSALMASRFSAIRSAQKPSMCSSVEIAGPYLQAPSATEHSRRHQAKQA